MKRWRCKGVKFHSIGRILKWFVVTCGGPLNQNLLYAVSWKREPCSILCCWLLETIFFKAARGWCRVEGLGSGLVASTSKWHLLIQAIAYSCPQLWLASWINFLLQPLEVSKRNTPRIPRIFQPWAMGTCNSVPLSQPELIEKRPGSQGVLRWFLETSTPGNYICSWAMREWNIEKPESFDSTWWSSRQHHQTSNISQQYIQQGIIWFLLILTNH